MPVYQVVTPVQPPMQNRYFSLNLAFLGVFVSLLSAKTLVLRTTMGVEWDLETLARSKKRGPK